MLVEFLKVDRDAVICDLAETYQIFEYKSVPATELAVFVLGLPRQSRIKTKLSNQQADLTDILLAGILDRLSILVWFSTKDGQKGQNRPKSISEMLFGQDDIKNKEIYGFEDAESFEVYRKKLIGGE